MPVSPAPAIPRTGAGVRRGFGVEGLAGTPRSPDTGRTSFEADLGTLGAGRHRATIGLYDNRRTRPSRWMNLPIDGVRITVRD